MTTRAERRGQNLTYFKGATQERVAPFAPVVFYDDFLGFELLQTEAGSAGVWSTVEVLLNTAIALAADEANGAVSLALDADVNAEDAVLYWGDQKGISLKHLAIIEFRARISVLPTLTSQIVLGMAGDHNLDKDALTESAWFKFDGSGAVLCETDDTTNNNDDIASGVTATAAQTKIYRIDFTDLTNVLFFIDGVHVASPGSGTDTTFDMSNLTDAEAVMQPYFSLDKGADAGLGTLLLDYVRIWSNRSA